MEFTNSQIELQNIPKIEDVLLKPISKKYLNIIIINKTILFSVLFIVLFILKLVIDDNEVQAVFWYAFFVLVLISIANFIISVMGFKKRKYAVREHDVIYSKGLLFHSITTVPIHRIQHIEESRSWLARQFGLAALNIYTAGESGSDLSIKGLPHDEAKQIKEFISSKVNAIN